MINKTVLPYLVFNIYLWLLCKDRKLFFILSHKKSVSIFGPFSLKLGNTEIEWDAQLSTLPSLFCNPWRLQTKQQEVQTQ